MECYEGGAIKPNQPLPERSLVQGGQGKSAEEVESSGWLWLAAFVAAAVLVLMAVCHGG